MHARPHFIACQVACAAAIACSGEEPTPEPDCVLRVSLAGGATQTVSADSRASCGAGSLNPTGSEMYFNLEAAPVVHRFEFRIADLHAQSAGAALATQIRLVPSLTDTTVPGWLANSCTSTVDRVRVTDGDNSLTIADVTAHGICDEPASPEPGNAVGPLTVGPFEFVGIAVWN